MSIPSACGSSGGSKKRDRENSDEHDMTMDESMESIDAFPVASGSGVNQSKSQKTGKLYNCIYCSYSADKKVSLNRHMRMHSGLSISSSNQMPNTSTKDEQGQLSAAAVAAAAAALGSRPVTPGKSSSSSIQSTSKNAQDGCNAMERYCQDCDIQFSSIKTFRVHKQYYCSTRHVLKAQQTAVAAAVAAAAAAVAAGGNPVTSAALGKAPVELGPGVTVTPVGKSSASIASACSPIPGEGSPGSTPGPMNSQPFVVLPTNPIIVVPYCFIQGASFLPGNVLPSQNAIVVLPNGSVQSMPGSSGAIPIPSPSPQSMMLGSHLMMHSPFPTSATPGPSNAGNGSGIMSPNNLAFPDPKEMMKMMSGSTKELSSRDEDEMMSPSKLAKSHSRSSGRSSRSSDDAIHQHHHDHHSRGHGSEVCDESSMPAIDLTFRGIQPKKEQTSGGDEEKENRGGMCGSSAGIETRSSRNISRDSMQGALEENSRSRSVTPAAISTHHAGTSLASSSTSHHQNIHDSHHHHHHRESISPLEKMSIGSGSGGKRTPRPSSASVSSSCSTPPALCEPKLNGMMSHIMSPGAKDHHNDPSGLNNKMAMMMMLNAGAAAAAAAVLESGNGSANSGASRSGKANKAPVDYNSVIEMTRSSRGGSSSSSVTGANGGKISPVATQLPGGAILTSATSNQSLAELLMTNPPELNESLAKLNPQLLMNAHRAASGGSPVGFNFNLNPAFMQALSPEIAMRLLDPAYLSTLQQTLQQQQQQQLTSTTPQPPQVPVKRGVSKCIECDIVFYKYENYLVHKEHYCAARTNNVAGGVSNSNNFPQSKSSTSSSSKSHLGKGIRDNGNHRGNGKDTCRMSSCSSPSKSEVDDDECISPPPPPVHRKGSIHSQQNMRKSPDALVQPLLASKPKTKSPQNAIMSPVSISPVPSPKGFGVIASNVKDHGKGGSSNNFQFPCSICGVKFSTIDNLQTHQTYYCTKRKAGSSGYDNNGENDYCGGNGESKSGSGNNNGDAMIMGLPTSGNASSPHEKDMMTGGISSMARGNKSPGSRNGFLRCGKCKLPIPEEQMSTHIRVCLGTASPSFGGNGGRGGGGELGVGGVGWKCPCCDVYSPTVSAAQKHLETHTGIRAFKCLLCGYRGNTLRGMRTHIRTHFDKRVFDLLEADYMTCITANDVEPTASANNNNSSNNNSNSSSSSHINMNSPPLHSDQIHRAMSSPNSAASGVVNRAGGLATASNESGAGSNNKANSNSKHSRYSPESCKNSNQLSKSSNPADIRESPSPNAASFTEEGSDIKVFHSPSDMMMMTMMTETDSGAENNNQLHYCNLCNYSSPFKGNILKHMKLVHKVQIPLDMTSAAEAEAAALMLMHGGVGAGDHEGLATMSMIMNRGAAASLAAPEMMMEDVNGTSGGDSSRNSTPKSTLEYAIAQGFSITSPPAKSLSPAAVAASTTVSSSMSESCSTVSTRSRRAATAVQNGTTGIPSKEERISSENIDGERKCSSHSSAEDDIGSGNNSSSSTTKPAEKQQQQSSSSMTTTGSASSSSGTTGGSGGGNYCKSCDISFNYVSSFNAHKKFYCSSQVSSDTETPERAETPVQ